MIDGFQVVNADGKTLRFIDGDQPRFEIETSGGQIRTFECYEGEHEFIAKELMRILGLTPAPLAGGSTKTPKGPGDTIVV